MIERDFLLLDGDCGLCHRLATFVDKRMAKGQDLFNFAKKHNLKSFYVDDINSERSLYILNNLPCCPTLFCVNNTGPDIFR